MPSKTCPRVLSVSDVTVELGQDRSKCISVPLSGTGLVGLMAGFEIPREWAQEWSIVERTCAITNSSPKHLPTSLVARDSVSWKKSQLTFRYFVKIYLNSLLSFPRLLSDVEDGVSNPMYLPSVAACVSSTMARGCFITNNYDSINCV